MRLILSGDKKISKISYIKTEDKKNVNQLLKFIEDNINNIKSIEIKHK